MSTFLLWIWRRHRARGWRRIERQLNYRALSTGREEHGQQRADWR